MCAGRTAGGFWKAGSACIQQAFASQAALCASVHLELARNEIFSLLAWQIVVVSVDLALLFLHGTQLVTLRGGTDVAGPEENVSCGHISSTHWRKEEAETPNRGGKSKSRPNRNTMAERISIRRLDWCGVRCCWYRSSVRGNRGVLAVDRGKIPKHPRLERTECGRSAARGEMA